MVVAGYAIETPRLLLNSATDRFPDGLANSSGLVGKYLMVQSNQAVWGTMEQEVRSYKGPPSLAISEHWNYDDNKDFHGESPVWCDRQDALFWLDMRAPCLHLFDPATGRDQRWDLPAWAGSCALTKEGDVLVALRTGAHVLRPETGALAFLAPAPCDPRRFALNDGKSDPAGRFYVGGMYHSLDPGGPDGAAMDWHEFYWCAVFGGGCLLCFDPDGRLERKIEMPVQYPTMPAFGGPGLGTLFLTSASWPLSEADRSRRTQEGCLFALQPPVPGLPVARVRMPRHAWP